MLVTISAIFTVMLAVLLLVLAVAGVAALFGCRFKKFFLCGLWAELVPLVLFFYGMFVERNTYEVTEVSVTSRDVPESFECYTIVQISDLHLASFKSRPRSLEKAVRKINSLEADLVLFTGDLVTSHPSEMDGLEEILSGVKAKDGVYSVLGNHDYCIYYRWESDSLRKAAVEQVVSRQRAMGWNLLMNGHVDIVRPSAGSDPAAVMDTISVIGVENISESTYFPSYGDLDKAMSGAEGSFKILMTHDPTHWKKAISEYPDINLTLSGHTHAMQLSLFGWSPSSLMFDEYRGLYSIAGGIESSGGNAAVGDGTENLLYVNIGLGETAIPARIGTPPEITRITLHSAE